MNYYKAITQVETPYLDQENDERAQIREVLWSYPAEPPPIPSIDIPLNYERIKSSLMEKHRLRLQDVRHDKCQDIFCYNALFKPTVRLTVCCESRFDFGITLSKQKFQKDLWKRHVTFRNNQMHPLLDTYYHPSPDIACSLTTETHPWDRDDRPISYISLPGGHYCIWTPGDENEDLHIWDNGRYVNIVSADGPPLNSNSLMLDSKRVYKTSTTWTNDRYDTPMLLSCPGCRHNDFNNSRPAQLQWKLSRHGNVPPFGLSFMGDRLHYVNYLMTTFIGVSGLLNPYTEYGFHVESNGLLIKYGLCSGDLSISNLYFKAMSQLKY